MSFFLEILRCILCCGEDDDRCYYRTTRSNISREYRHHETVPKGSSSPLSSSYDTLRRTSIDDWNSGTVNSIAYGSVKTSPVNRPTVTQTPLRFPPNPSSPEVTQKLTCVPLRPSPTSVQQNKPVDSAVNGKSTITAEQETIKSSREKRNKGTNNLATAPPVAVFSNNELVKNQLLSSNKAVICSYGSVKSPVIPPAVNSIPFGSVKKSPVNPPTVAQTSLRLPPTPVPPKVTLKPSDSFASISKLPTSSSKLSSSFSLLGPQNTTKKTKYVVVDKDIASIYVIPDGIKNLIKKDIVPEVLKRPVSALTYKDYFAALLYSEDFYVEKWSNFCLTNMNLELHKASIYKKSNKSNNFGDNDEHDDKMLVAFQIDLIPEKRPFLLSRDFVFVRPSGKSVEPFQGILYRVVKSTLVLAEFGDDFYSKYAANHKYDISFSFNRVCLKRCHQAVQAATNSLFQSFLFPVQINRINSTALSSFFTSQQNLDQDQTSAISQISRLTGPPPFLIEGPLCVTSKGQLSKTGLVIREAVLKIYRTTPCCRILINAPRNSTCDLLLRSLTKGIPETEMFRANAAFREVDGVPYDILPSCEYNLECFTCPSLLELSNFKVILSTFISSFRIHNEGIHPGHFSHIFLLDASSATEPETMVSLSNLVDEKTSVVVTGALGNTSGWVRSDIGRRNGLKKSYFQRLLESNPYKNLDRKFVVHLGDNYP